MMPRENLSRKRLLTESSTLLNEVDADNRANLRVRSFSEVDSKGLCTTNHLNMAKKRGKPRDTKGCLTTEASLIGLWLAEARGDQREH